MFEAFYGLAKTPFARDIPTDQLYQSIMLEEILGRLEYAARRRFFAVITDWKRSFKYIQKGYQ